MRVSGLVSSAPHYSLLVLAKFDKIFFFISSKSRYVFVLILIYKMSI